MNLLELRKSLILEIRKGRAYRTWSQQYVAFPVCQMSIVTFNSSYMHLCPLWLIVKVVPINDCSGLENCHSVCINLFDVYYIHNHMIKWHPLLIKFNCHGPVNGKLFH